MAVALACLLGAGAARGAELELVMIRLSHLPQQAARTYTVPAGMILITELVTVNAGSYGGTPSRVAPKLEVSGAGAGNHMTISIGGESQASVVTLAPWKFDAGWTLAVDPPVLPGPLGAGAYSDVSLLGLLLDKSLLLRYLLGNWAASGFQVR